MWIDGPWALLAYEYRAKKVAKKKRLKKGARQAKRQAEQSLAAYLAKRENEQC